MIAQALAEFPNECCGLLAGTIGTGGIARAERRYPLVNELASPTEYLWEPKSRFAAERDMRPLGIEMLAIYHSHPATDPIPSRKDRDRYDEVRPLVGDLMHFIVGLRESVPEVRAWWLSHDDHREADWEVV
jgi:[CysO sulfur-carrier protein]-S-L-cysteine hydrolase